MISTKGTNFFEIRWLFSYFEKTGKILNFPGCLNLSEHKVERKSKTIEQNWRWCYSSMVFKGRIDIRMQWMTGNGFMGHLRVCHTWLLQKSAAHEFACLCACMSVYAFGRGYRDTFLEFPRLRSHLHTPTPTPTPHKSKCPAGLSMRWPGLCHNRICLVWGRGCPGCRPCPRCPRPHPLLLPLTSRPESGPPRLRLPTRHWCRRFLPTRLLIQTSQTGLCCYVLESGRSPQEHLRRELSPVRYLALLKNAPYAS